MEFIDWRNSPELPRDGYYVRRVTPIGFIVIHNSGSDADIQSNNDYHRGDSFGAPHLAYTFRIDREGTVVWANELWEASWHAKDANDEGLGICLQGNLELTQPAPAQLEALQWLLEVKLPGLGVDLSREKVYGHGEPVLRRYGNNTICPGKNMLRRIVDYREARAPLWSTAPVEIGGNRFFAETGHWMGGGFRVLWERLESNSPECGSVAVYGYPLDEEHFDSERNCIVQNCQRARFEYHPENPDPWTVQLGLANQELMELRRGR
ncbi:MAG: peptidoglycan recognition protein family protein [Chloroflexi bacterium]|nr:peptidoglycan recognition protein family protein [Chloroflexota bacterium]